MTKEYYKSIKGLYSSASMQFMSAQFSAMGHGVPHIQTPCWLNVLVYTFSSVAIQPLGACT